MWTRMQTSLVFGIVVAVVLLLSPSRCEAFGLWGASSLTMETELVPRFKNRMLIRDLNRRAMLITLVGGIVLPPVVNAQPVFPAVGEVEAAVPASWSKVVPPWTSRQDFARLDESPDAEFYADPRFVEHVDAAAVRTMERYLMEKAVRPTDVVLDLGASWTSHLQPFNPADTKAKPCRRLVGLGMNLEELRSNPSLDDYVVVDLNQDPTTAARTSTASTPTTQNKETRTRLIPFDDGTFDVVLCQLTVDYLTRPLEVMREVARVLKRGEDENGGGTVHILFSNRLFLSKAVGIWTGADDVDHVFTVASYLHYCSGGNETTTDTTSDSPAPLFVNIRAKDLSTRDRRGNVVGDPLYVVVATRA